MARLAQILPTYYIDANRQTGLVGGTGYLRYQVLTGPAISLNLTLL